MVPYFYLVCAGAVSLSAPIDPLEKFDETMKKMDWSHLVPPMLPEKDADGPATSIGAAVMPTPAASGAVVRRGEGGWAGVGW